MITGVLSRKTMKLIVDYSNRRNNMGKEKVYMLPNLITPNRPVEFDEEICNGCNRCVNICMFDVLFPNPEKDKPPILLYPDECWRCGCCLMECPLRDKGAIKVSFPLILKMRWKRKETGEHFRLGMPNPPSPNTRPPVGGWDPRV